MYRLSASYSSQWMNCHAATDLETALPGFELTRSDTPASTRGTNMHAILAAAIAFGTKSDLDDIVQMLSYVNDLWATRRFNVLVEHKMSMAWMKDPAWTTADVILYLVDELHIIDHKAGSIVVDPDDPQLKSYGAAARALNLAPKAKGVWLHVNQPKAKNQVKVWISNEELDAFIAEQQRHEEELLAGDLSFGPQHKACQFCPANPMSRGAKGNVLCAQAIRPANRWSDTDLLHLIQVQEDNVRSTPRIEDEL